MVQKHLAHHLSFVFRDITPIIHLESMKMLEVEKSTFRYIYQVRLNKCRAVPFLDSADIKNMSIDVVDNMKILLYATGSKNMQKRNVIRNGEIMFETFLSMWYFNMSKCFRRRNGMHERSAGNQYCVRHERKQAPRPSLSFSEILPYIMIIFSLPVIHLRCSIIRGNEINISFV